MKLHLILLLLLSMALAACGSPQPAAPTSAPAATTAPAATSAPAAQPTSIPPTQPPPTAVPPANTSAPAPTQPPAAPTDTIAPQPTDTATATPAAAKPRPTPTSAGPLSAAIYVANCRSAPTSDKPGRVIIQISVEATGGNGQYGYTYQNKNYPTKFIDVIGEKGTRSIGEVLITSGNQQLKQEFNISPGDLTCP